MFEPGMSHGEMEGEMNQGNTLAAEFHVSASEKAANDVLEVSVNRVKESDPKDGMRYIMFQAKYLALHKGLFNAQLDEWIPNFGVAFRKEWYTDPDFRQTCIRVLEDEKFLEEEGKQVFQKTSERLGDRDFFSREDLLADYLRHHLFASELESEDKEQLRQTQRKIDAWIETFSPNFKEFWEKDQMMRQQALEAKNDSAKRSLLFGQIDKRFQGIPQNPSEDLH